MKIEELFLKPVDRPIDGVIKADDTRNLQAELEEYVFTRDVVKGLGALTDRYLTDISANGVWISGFFGSGKSHLLKMLSLLLGETTLPSGLRPIDILLPKVEDEILRADLAKCAAIPSRSILFNIAQKFDGIGGDNLWRSREALREGGRVVVYGFQSKLRGGRIDSGAPNGRHPIRESAILGSYILRNCFLAGRKSMVPYSIQWLMRLKPAWFHQDLLTLFDLLQQKKINPLIAERLPLCQARHAHELLGNGGVIGKLVLIANE